ncbi:uncharacterized protein [Dendropsophus ebraccatus]|uniref:uncharacterized protein n=1 Tax=Dendropsophus ebraccatus TaxID=150705 RepID=UPI0038313D5A
MREQREQRAERTERKGRLQIEVTMRLVGVFSRDDESSSRWLVNRILSWKNVRDVRPVTITNNFETFRVEASKCNFGVLYHSKNRGRVNVTDVTDSLYDDELQHLSAVYGRNKVLVVIDDLDNSSEEEKYRILSHQPTIQRLAQDLFLFSSADKAALNASGYQMSHNVHKALDGMKNTIEGGSDWIIPVDERQQVGTLCKTRRCVVIWIVGGAIIVLILILVLSLIH